MKNFLKFLAVAVAVLVIVPGAQAKKYKEGEVADGGTITGQVMAGSAEAEVQSFPITKNPELCGEGNREVEWVRINDGALLDTVVYLVEVDAGKPFTEESQTLSINQQGCRFAPYLSTMANRGELHVTNSDGALHNIHTYELIGSARRTVINVSQPEAGDEFTKTIKLRKGNAMKVECDAHDFMHAWVFVAKNPYFAVVDENGQFTIEDVPPGTYEIRSWNGRLGEQEATVEVGANGSVEVNFSY